MKKQSFFIIFIMIIAIGIGLFRDHQEKIETHTAKLFTTSTLNNATLLLPSKKLMAFEFMDMYGKPFTNNTLRDHWTFFFFGYTHCPDICPITLGRLHQLALRLKGIPSVQFVFFSIDPENDSPPQLQAFLKQDQFKGASFKGVTGNKSNILSFAESLGIAVSREPGNQTIDHSGSLLLINPRGECVAIFTSTDKPHLIAHDVKEILHRHANGQL